MATTMVDGILICMSAGLYEPFVQVRDGISGKKFICDANSRAAKEAGMANEKHWAWDVYSVLKKLCGENQEALHGGSMAAYEETALDRMAAAEAQRHGYGD